MTTVKIIGSYILLCVFSITQVLSQGCLSPLGMENGRIKDSQITTSSVLKGRSPYGYQARLNQNIPQWGAWCPDNSGGKKNEKNYDQYIQIDLLNLTKITAIATQERQYLGGREYVRDYKISYRSDGGVMKFYQEKDQTVKIFQGNTDVSTVVRHNLDPAIMARYIRVHPGYLTNNIVCMRLELYGCVPVIGKDILSYTMPVGQAIKSGKVTYNDTSYNGVITNSVYKNGIGILTDGKFGPDDAKQDNGKGWVGWSSYLTESSYIDITFEFSGVRKFKDVTLTVNVDKTRSYAVFDKSEIFFASKQDDFSDTSFLQHRQKDFIGSDASYSTNITLSLCENTARFIKLSLYFGGGWLLITEISFNSVPVSKDDEKTRFQNCSCNSCYSSSQISSFQSQAMSTTASPTSTPRTDIRKKCECKEAANSIAIFFVGVAVTLFVVLVVFVSIWFYIRRRQTPKLSTAVLKVDTIEMQNETPPESSPNNQERDHGGPINGETTTYEEVPNSPPSVYTELNRNQRNENTNDNAYQKLLKPYSDYAIPAEDHPYEEVRKKRSPPGYKELDQTKREDADVSYQKLVKK